MTSSPENLLRRVGRATAGFAERTLGGDENERVSTNKTGKITRRTLLKATAGVLVGGPILASRANAQEPDPATVNPPLPSDVAMPPVEAANPGGAQGVDVVPVVGGEKSVDIGRDLSSQKFNEILQTIPDPPFVELYFGKIQKPNDTPESFDLRRQKYADRENNASRVWRAYQAIAQMHGGVFEESANHLAGYLTPENGGVKTIRKYPPYGETNVGLGAPIPEDWPPSISSARNMIHVFVVEKANDKGQFRFINMIWIGSENIPDPNNLVALAGSLIYTDSSIDLADTMIRGLLVGKLKGIGGKSETLDHAVTDANELNSLMSDPSSAPRKELTIWAWGTTLGKIVRELEGRPHNFDISHKFGALLKEYQKKKDDPNELRKFLEENFSSDPPLN